MTITKSGSPTPSPMHMLLVEGGQWSHVCRKWKEVRSGRVGLCLFFFILTTTQLGFSCFNHSTSTKDVDSEAPLVLLENHGGPIYPSLYGSHTWRFTSILQYWFSHAGNFYGLGMKTHTGEVLRLDFHWYRDKIVGGKKLRLGSIL